jgi:hypothetical protein
MTSSSPPNKATAMSVEEKENQQSPEKEETKNSPQRMTRSANKQMESPQQYEEEKPTSPEKLKGRRITSPTRGKKRSASESTDSKKESAPEEEEKEEEPLLEESDKQDDAAVPPSPEKHEESSVGEDPKPESSTTTKPAPIICTTKRPVKRSKTAYFIFMDEKRPEVQKQHAGEGVAAFGRALGLLWGNLTPEEKAVYQAKAAVERERVAQELVAWKAAGGVDPVPTTAEGASNTDPASLIMPVNVRYLVLESPHANH